MNLIIYSKTCLLWRIYALTAGFCMAFVPGILAQGQRHIFELVNKMEMIPEVFSMDTDEYGRIWYSTWGRGVFCYDGYDNHRYLTDINNPLTIDNDRIFCLLTDQQKRVWISSMVGLNCLDRKTGNVKRFKNFVDSLGRVTAIFEDKSGVLWFGTEKACMQFDEKSQTCTIVKCVKDGKKIEGRIHVLYQDREGNLWAGSTKGVFLYNRQEGVFEKMAIPQDPGIVTSFLETQHGSFILGSHSGLFYFDRHYGVAERIQLPDSLAHRRVNTLLETPGGTIWIGYFNDGLVSWNYLQGGFKQFKNNPFDPGSLPYNRVWSLAYDQFGNLWVGCQQKLARINLLPQAFTLWPILSEKPVSRENSIVRMAQDRLGGILVRTVEGLYYIEKLGATPVEIQIEGKTLLPWDFCVRADGTVLAVMGDLFQWEPATRMFYRIKTPAGSILNMEEDRDDPQIWWFGTGGGLLKYDKRAGRTQTFPLDSASAFLSKRVGILVDDGHGALWLDLENRLCRFDKRTNVVRFFTSDSLPPHQLVNNEILDLNRAPNGDIWVSTSGGISVINPVSLHFSNLNRHNGLPDNLSSTVLFDQHQHAWIVTPENIVRQDFITREFKIFNTAADFQTATWTRGRCMLQDGKLLFAGVKGILSLDPSQTNIAQPVTRILLNRFEVTGSENVQYANPEDLKLIQLSNDQNSFSIEWAGIQTANPRELTYECKLERVGEKLPWEYKGADRVAVYAKLSAGAYTFSARVIGSDAPPLVLQIAIAPAWWQTSWFKLLLLAMACTLAYIIWLYREKQRQLEQQKELAVQNAVYKTRFLANMSHEIRTPMNAILGMSRLLTEKSLPEKEATYAAAIRQSSENLLVIINDVLDQAKIESGKFSFTQKPFELDVILFHLKNTLGFKASEKGLAFEIQISPSTPGRLIGDSVRLIQILTNLLGNAIKFTDNGFVKLKVTSVEPPLNSIENATWLSFTVTDTGIGIPEEQKGHVFESFTQANEAISTLYGGSGLGLSITKEMIEQQGGKIDLWSEVGRGTMVEVVMPFAHAEGEPEPEEKKRHEFQFPAHLKILLVEDTYFNQMLATELLKKNIPGVEIELAENGLIALEKLETGNDYDVVLMDIKMPVMDGLEATRRLRQIPGKTQLPVVALTANAVQEELDKCKAAGMDAWVTKPIEINKLLETLKQVLTYGNP